MHPSGQNTQQIRHFVHFSGLATGRKVLQEPVLPVLAMRGRESGVIGRSFLLFGAFAIGATMVEVELSIESRVKVFRMNGEKRSGHR